MKIIDLLESRPHTFALMYHGTSDKFLKSILQHGLLPSGSDLGYKNIKEPETAKIIKNVPQTYGSEFPAYLSFPGGVYITPDHDVAKDAANSASNLHGGNPMIIEIIHLKTGGVIDEDNVFNSYVRNIITFYIKYYRNNQNISDDQLNNKALTDPALLAEFLEFAKRKVKNYSRFTKKSELLIKEFFINVLREVIAIFKDPIYNYGYTPDVCEFECKETFTLKIMAVPKIRALMNDFVDTLKNFNTDGPVRITKPINFKGNTRIIRIYRGDKTLYIDRQYLNTIRLVEQISGK